MVRYVSPESLSAFHVDTFDRFASTFTQSETAMELNAAGRLKMVSRFCKFTNIVELSKMFRSCADVILPEDLAGIPMRLSPRLDNFYEKIGVKPLGLLYPIVCRLQVPK